MLNFDSRSSAIFRPRGPLYLRCLHFGWMKTVGGLRQTRYRGLERTGLPGNLVATAYNLVRMARLLVQAAATPEALMT